MAISEYQVTGMSCGHCEAAVRGEVSQLAGAEDVQVSAKTGRLTVTASAAISDEDVLAAVDEAGYTATRA
ncbi:heavy-metal-associated domain-containing protein [Microbacterium sp. zg.Y1084]|uniref:heavy-metal-associated domain-containing protein n=1 Tax=Microbacterium sp. zg.Y1084 TaxID=2969667 RepID=UPI00214BD185|nr:heavy metal-associated domain-containing protein [Microbacterium sp. zg.Y1084]MCR2812120.1 heavy-metal-associated domain-containing protein [Microbacterium sp. zg.Y1084]